MRSIEGPRHRESPELNTERVERASREILESPEVIDFLQRKITEKLEFKQRISHDDGSNDYSPWKRLGMFIVHEQKLPEKLVSILQRNDIEVYGDEVLELHIPMQEASMEEVKKSLARLREYLEVNQRERNIPKYIYGVSYLAPLAKRWGFKIVDLPQDLQEKSGAAGLLRSYADAESDPKKQGIAKRFATEDIKLCLMSVDELLAERN